MSKSLHAQELTKHPKFDIRTVNEFVISAKIINDKYTVTTAEYSKFSTPQISKYIVCGLVYLYVRKGEKFNQDYLIKTLRKNPYDKSVWIVKIKKRECI